MEATTSFSSQGCFTDVEEPFSAVPKKDWEEGDDRSQSGFEASAEFEVPADRLFGRTSLSVSGQLTIPRSTAVTQAYCS